MGICSISGMRNSRIFALEDYSNRLLLSKYNANAEAFFIFLDTCCFTTFGFQCCLYTIFALKPYRGKYP